MTGAVDPGAGCRPRKERKHRKGRGTDRAVKEVCVNAYFVELNIPKNPDPKQHIGFGSGPDPCHGEPVRILKDIDIPDCHRTAAVPSVCVSDQHRGNFGTLRTLHSPLTGAICDGTMADLRTTKDEPSR